MIKTMKKSAILSKYNRMPQPAKASIWFFVCSVLQKGISVLTTPVFSRLLSTSEYGQYNTISSWTSLLTIFVTLELSSGVYTQALVKFDGDKKRLSSSLQGLTFCLTIAWMVVYLLFREVFNRLIGCSTIQVISMIGIIWSTASFGFWASEQRNEYKYKALVYVTLIISIIKPIIEVIAVLNFDDKVTARLIGTSIVDCIVYSVFFIVQMKNGGQFFSSLYWKYALKYNIPLVPHYLSQTFLIAGDKIMIERMVGASSAGVYSLAYSIAQIMTLINTAVNATLGPWIYKKIKEKRNGEIAQAGYLCLALVAFANVFLLLVAPEIVAIAAPKEYAEAIYSITPITISAFFMFAYNLFAKFEFYYEKTKYVSIATAAAALLNILLNYLLIPQFGYIVAGYTTLFCYCFYAVFHFACMRIVLRSRGENPDVYKNQVLLMITLIFVLLCALIASLYNYPIIRYGTFVVVLVALLSAKKQIISFVKKVIKK